MSSTGAIHVIGHKNPDTDSICSAVAYSYLKSKISDNSYIPCRAGNVNPETEFALNYFKIKAPVFTDDVRVRVKDTEIDKIRGVSEFTSMKKAYEYMHACKAVSLAVLDGKKLKGIITMGDITSSYMEIYDSNVIADAKTPYKNITETINGVMVVGDENRSVEDGKVVIAASGTDIMRHYIQKGDIVIMGDRYEAQIGAIELGASCIIISSGAKVSGLIKKLAEENGCRVIESPYDSYTLARLMNQSMPVGRFMTKGNIDYFTTNDFLDDVKETMREKRFRNFPVVDENGDYVGMISRHNLLTSRKNKLILVDHNEKTQAVRGLEQAEILEIIDHHRIGNIETAAPAFFRNQPVGCTATIIYSMYMENAVEIPADIAGIMLSAILSDTLAFRSPTCTNVDKIAAENLAKIAGITDIEGYATEMFTAGSNLRNKTAEEIFFADFKKFAGGNLTFGVGQISAMSREELSKAKDKVSGEMEKYLTEQKCDMLFFMLTNIMEESSGVICRGAGAQKALEKGFGKEVTDENGVYMRNLPGVVSRKKQMIPNLMNAVADM